MKKENVIFLMKGEKGMYSIWLLEYCHVPTQPIGSVLSGQHNAGFRELSFIYMVLKGNGLNILIDTGTDGNDPVTQAYHKRDSVTNWHSPEEVLKKVGLKPEDINYVLITHAHYDHMDNLKAFPNAKFIIQEKELLGWVWAMTRPRKFRAPHMALKSQNIYEALHLVEEERMTMVDGDVKDILPDIDLKAAFDGHTFGSQAIVINNEDGPWVNVGDMAYVRENLTGFNNDGVYVPVGLAVGTPYNITKSIDEVIDLVGGKLNRIIIGHETDNWDIYPSKKCEDGLYMAEIALAEGETSKL